MEQRLLLSFVLLTLFSISHAQNGRLFNAPKSVLTSIQVVGADWPELMSQYRAREKEYGIVLDFYSFFINCEMVRHQGYQLSAAQISAVKSYPESKGLQIHYECREAAIFNKLKNRDATTMANYQKFFDSVFQNAGRRRVWIRPFQEFNNAWTGYPWVLEQWHNIWGCGCSWCSCATGFYSDWGNLDKNRAELNAVMLHLRAASRERLRFIITIDANTLSDDRSSVDRIAGHVAAVSRGFTKGVLVGLDGYRGVNGPNWRDTKQMFVDGPNTMNARQPSLAPMPRAITEMGVAKDSPDRRGSLCAALSGNKLRLLVYWDGPGAGGDYKLTRELANVNCPGFSAARAAATDENGEEDVVDAVDSSADATSDVNAAQTPSKASQAQSIIIGCVVGFVGLFVVIVVVVFVVNRRNNTKATIERMP